MVCLGTYEWIPYIKEIKIIIIIIIKVKVKFILVQATNNTLCRVQGNRSRIKQGALVLACSTISRNNSWRWQYYGIQNRKPITPSLSNNYKHLTIDKQCMWDTKTKVTPATGTISKSLAQYLSNIPEKNDIKELQKSAMLGIAHKPRKVLTLKCKTFNMGNYFG